MTDSRTEDHVQQATLRFAQALSQVPGRPTADSALVHATVGTGQAVLALVAELRRIVPAPLAPAVAEALLSDRWDPDEHETETVTTSTCSAARCNGCGWLGDVYDTAGNGAPYRVDERRATEQGDRHQLGHPGYRAGTPARDIPDPPPPIPGPPEDAPT